jgi:hypothetical protein
MKRILIVVCMFVLVFGVSLWAQTTVPKPDPEFKKFDVFLGHWTYEGENIAGPLGPGSKVSGEETGKRILGGFFIEFQLAEKGPMGETKGIEIVGYEPANKTFLSDDYYDDGTTATGAYVFNGNTVTYLGKFIFGSKPYLVKNTMMFAADSMSFTVKGEISTDGKIWAPFFKGQFTKAKPVPKK